MSGPVRSLGADPVEEPLYLPMGEERLFAVFTRPVDAARPEVATMLPGAGVVTNTHRNAMFVRVARALAGLGYASLRVDYRGLGESSGSTRLFSLDRLEVETARAARDWVERQDGESHLLVGTCFGARSLLASLEGTERIRGVCLVSPPVHDFPVGAATGSGAGARPPLRAVLRRVGRLAWDARFASQRRRYWHWIRDGLLAGLSAVGRAVRTRSRPRLDLVSPSFLRPLQQLSKRGIPVTLLYGAADREYHDLRRALEGRLGRLLEQSPSFELHVVDGRVHAFETLAAQDAVVDTVTAFAARLAAADTGTPAPLDVPGAVAGSTAHGVAARADSRPA